MTEKNKKKAIYQPDPHEIIPIKQWATINDKTVGGAIRLANDGRLPEAIRINGHWYIEACVPWPLRRSAKPTGEERIQRGFALIQRDFDKLTILARQNNWSAALEIAYLINAEYNRLRLKQPESPDQK